MTESAFALLMVVIFGWAVTSNRLGRWNITGPFVFMLAGFLLGNQSWGPVPIDAEAPSVHLLAELTLAMLLFSDAVRVNVGDLRHDLRVPARLLGVGLPLTLMLGTVAAVVLFGDFTWALALFVGAALAPTDAALSAQVINDQRIPTRVRRVITVESGLNDGIVTPIVVLSLALVAGQLGTHGGDDAGIRPLLELAIGTVVGTAFGWGGAKLIASASHRTWMSPGGRRLATLAVALGSFAGAVTFGGNGFIAAFVAGIAFSAALGNGTDQQHELSELAELLGELLSFGVWFLFGAALVPVAFELFSAWTLLYAVASLTLFRMVPVALALTRTGLDRSTVLFVGWFGPRGLASIVFALLAIEELGDVEPVRLAISVVSLTVLLSVILHGVSAAPIGRRYALQHSDALTDRR
ncbi:cation:proton antiporter [Arthrobacter sp. MDT1-65]